MRPAKAPTHNLEKLDPAVRQRIENAAMSLFASREYHMVGMDEVARTAQCSLQTLYKYYGNRDTLLYACLQDWMGRLAARMLDHLQGIETYRDRLGKVFWLVLDFFDAHPEVAELISGTVYGRTWRQDESYRQAVLTKTFLEVLEEGRKKGILNDEVPPHVLLDFIYGVLMRTIETHLVRGQQQPLTTNASLLFDMVWRAIAKPTA